MACSVYLKKKKVQMKRTEGLQETGTRKLEFEEAYGSWKKENLFPICIRS